MKWIDIITIIGVVIAIITILCEVYKSRIRTINKSTEIKTKFLMKPFWTPFGESKPKWNIWKAKKIQKRCNILLQLPPIGVIKCNEEYFYTRVISTLEDFRLTKIEDHIYCVKKLYLQDKVETQKSMITKSILELRKTLIITFCITNKSDINFEIKNEYLIKSKYISWRSELANESINNFIDDEIQKEIIKNDMKNFHLPKKYIKFLKNIVPEKNNKVNKFSGYSKNKIIIINPFFLKKCKNEEINNIRFNVNDLLMKYINFRDKSYEFVDIKKWNIPKVIHKWMIISKIKKA